MINIIIQQSEETQTELMEDDIDDEKMLNIILEKLLDNQYEHLSEEDKAFLERYSRSLK
jgi:hypothetical protein